MSLVWHWIIIFIAIVLPLKAGYDIYFSYLSYSCLLTFMPALKKSCEWYHDWPLSQFFFLSINWFFLSFFFMEIPFMNEHGQHLQWCECGSVERHKAGLGQADPNHRFFKTKSDHFKNNLNYLITYLDKSDWYNALTICEEETYHFLK